MKEYSVKLDYYALLSLHKSLLEAKFHTAPENELISGSPLVANIYIQVRDLLIQSDKSSEWKEWFKLSNRPDRRNQAIIQMKKCERWNKASYEEKRKIAADFLAPFIFNDEELKNVIVAVDSSFSI